MVFQAIFWGTLVGLIFLLLVCCAFPCLQDRLILCSQRVCGARQFESEYTAEYYTDRAERARSIEISKAADAAADAAAARKGLPAPKHHKHRGRIPLTWLTWTMIVANVATLAIGIAIIVLSSYVLAIYRIMSIGIPALALSTMLTIVSISGICGARKKAKTGPSCWLLTYFFAGLIFIALLCYGIAYNMAFETWKVYIDDNWDVIYDALPASYRTGSSRTEQVASATNMIHGKLMAVAGACIAVAMLMSAALFAGARLIKAKTLASMTVAVLNHALTVFGLIFSVVGFYLLAGDGRAAGIIQMVGLVIGVGLFLLCMGVLGNIGLFKKLRPVLIIYGAANIMMIGILAYCIYFFATSSHDMLVYVMGLDDRAIANAADDIGLAMDKTTLVMVLQDSFNQLTVASGIGLGVCLVLSVALVMYVRAISRHDVVSGTARTPGVKERQGAEFNGTTPFANVSGGSSDAVPINVGGGTRGGTQS